MTSAPPRTQVDSKSDSLRVLFLNQAFWPDVAATSQHVDDLARFLVQRGDRVTVVASRSIYGASGATLPRRETHEGIEIFRVGVQLFGKRGIALRAVDFALFYVAALWRCIVLPRHDVVVCLTTPPFIALVGVLLKWFKGSRLVYWTMDLYPEVAGAAGVMRRGSALWRALQWIDRFCLRSSDSVVVLGECMRKSVVSKGAHSDTVRTISVWSGTESFQDRPRSENHFEREWKTQDRLTILYVGNFGLGHDMQAIAGAVEQLKSDDRIRWLFIGAGKAKGILESRVKESGATNVTLGGYQPRELLPELLEMGDVHIVSLLPGWEGLIVPCKFFSVLAAGKPVLWVGPHESACVTILHENQCGFEVAAGDSAALVEAIQKLAADRDEARAMGERARGAYKAKYSLLRACEQWRDVLKKVVLDNATSRA